MPDDELPFDGEDPALAGDDGRRHRRRSVGDDSLDRADRDPGGDGAVLPGLRHVGHHVAGAARRPRRPEAGAPPDPLGHGRPRCSPEPLAHEVRPRHRRRDGQVPPPRRGRPSTTPSSGWPRPSRSATRSSTATATSAVPTSDQPPRALHRVPAGAARHAAARRRSTRTPSTSRRTTPASSRSRSSCRRGSRTSSSTGARASRSAWRRTSRPTTSAR